MGARARPCVRGRLGCAARAARLPRGGCARARGGGHLPPAGAHARSGVHEVGAAAAAAWGGGAPPRPGRAAAVRPLYTSDEQKRQTRVQAVQSRLADALGGTETRVLYDVRYDCITQHYVTDDVLYVAY
eukprot:6967233-Pyramimonas_sp.AAC.1